MKEFLEKVGTFFSVFVMIVFGLAFIAGALTWVDDLSEFLQRDKEKNAKYERMQYLKDSLSVEKLKKELNEKDTTYIYSFDKIMEDDFERIPLDSNNKNN